MPTASTRITSTRDIITDEYRLVDMCNGEFDGHQNGIMYGMAHVDFHVGLDAKNTTVTDITAYPP